MITDFSDLEKVGRRHFLDVNGGSASSEELENVDGYETALLLIGEGDGTITPYGVIYDNGMQLRPVYDGQNFPLYQDGDSVFLLGLTHKSDPDMNPPTTWLFLPACRERLERTLRRGGYESEDDIHIRLSESTAPNEIDSRLDVEHESLNDLNKLASAIALLDVDQGVKLGAVVQMAKPRTAAEMTALAQNLDLFDFVPGIHSPREYGEFMIRESGNFDLDDDLAPFIDYEAYGQKQINAEDGEFNDQGYVAYKGPQSLSELMMRPPTEQRHVGPEMQMGGFSR